jgi:hypothetical protein
MPFVLPIRVAVLPQKHKQLGAADTFEDGVFSCRQLDWWMLQRWTHEKAILWERKEDKCLPCYHPTGKYSIAALEVLVDAAFHRVYDIAHYRLSVSRAREPLTPLYSIPDDPQSPTTTAHTDSL